MSAYLLGDIIFIAVWVVLYFVRPKSRNLQLFGSFLLLPFTILDVWFRPDYWHPPLLIKAIEPLSLETAIYCFTAGGIAIIFGNLFFKNNNSFKISWLKTIIFLIVAFGLYAIFHRFRFAFHPQTVSAMNNLNFSFLIIWGALLIVNFKKEWKSILPALLFATFTILAINFGAIFYPDFVAQYWNLPKLWPTFFNTPTEEIFFAGVLGALWAILPANLLKFEK